MGDGSQTGAFAMSRWILAVISMLPLATFATELAPGTLELSGSSNLSYAYTSYAHTKTTPSGAFTSTTHDSRLDLQADGLYYVIPNLGIGLSLGYTYDTGTDLGTQLSSSTLLVGPAIGYDFPIAPEFALFVRGDVVYVRESTKLGGGSSSNTSGWGAQAQGGLKYFPVKPLSLDVGLAYEYVSLRRPGDSFESFATTSSGLAVSVGLSVYLGR